MKRCLSLFLCLVMLLSFPLETIAVHAAGTPSIVCEDVTCQPGEQVTVDVTIENNPGFAYLSVTPQYDSALTLVKVENGELISDFTKGKQYIWVADEDVTQDGLLMRFTFAVAENAPAGEYAVGFAVRECANYDEAWVYLTAKFGTVTVKTPEAEDGDSGICGDNLTWKLADGVLTISGTGAMYDYPEGGTPWLDKKDAIQKIVIEEGITNIGIGTFYYCSNLTDIVIANTVTEIGTGAFSYCTKLKNLVIPEGVTHIGDLAFAGCTGLADVTIPVSMMNIDDRAFYLCTRLKNVYYGGNLELWNTITVASDNERLTNATIHTSIPDVDKTAPQIAVENQSVTKNQTFTVGVEIKNNPGFAYLAVTPVIPAQLTLVGVQNGELISDFTKGKQYIWVADEDITQDGLLMTFTFAVAEDAPEGNHFVNFIVRECANYDETRLELAVKPGIVTVKDAPLDEEPSGSCGENLTWTLMDGVLTISGTGAMDNYSYDTQPWNNWKDSITTVIIEEGVTTIGDAAFSNCTALKEIVIPNGITGIGMGAFFSCSSLPNIALPEGIVTIASGAFTDCKGLTEVSLPNSITEIGGAAFYGCTSLTDVYYDGTQKQWNAVAIGISNGPLTGATIHFMHIHAFSEWVVDQAPTCTVEGQKHRTCPSCGEVEYGTIDVILHTYDATVVPPTYFDRGYTVYTCSVCGHTYRDSYVDPLTRVNLSAATLTLEYDSAFYEGSALMPKVILTYQGKTYDAAKELKLTYVGNDQVGTATVIAEGINQFTGTVELQFQIAYEVIPEQITNVIAYGEIGKISLTWDKSAEVNTSRYNIYRKAEGESQYQLIKTITDRNVLTYEDKAVEKAKTYSYYVTGIGLYGAESAPSQIATATVAVDRTAPIVLKITPAAASVISGKTTLSANVTDNVGVTKVAYFYSVDNGETWVAIGETTNRTFSLVFDTTALGSRSIKVKAVAFDAEGNEGSLAVGYTLDNEGPDQVTGLSAVTLSSKITLSWKDVKADDAASFILQTKSGNEWKTVANNITTLGYTITGLQPGTAYTYRVACVDKRGNIGEYSDAFTATTTSDETAPVITSQSPNAARYNNTIRFSATAKDDCDIETIEIQVSTDLNSWTTISTNTYATKNYTQTYTYTIDLSNYAEGSLFVRAIAKDFSGNVSDTSSAAPYTEYLVDRTAPNAPSGVTANGNDGYITVSWAMGTEADLNKYSVYRATSQDGEYQLIASNLSALNYHDRNVQSGQEYFYKVTVSDSCGNVSGYSGVVSSTMSPDTKKPEITGISATYQQKISQSSHTIQVAANDNNKLSRVVVEYRTPADADYIQLMVAENINDHYKNISVTLPIDGLADGDVIDVRAYAVDMAGLQSEMVTTQYTLDTTPPAAKNFEASLNGSAVKLSWNDNGESDLSGFKVYRSADGKNFALIGTRGVSGTGGYQFADNLTAKESKTYIYKLEAIDRLGNVASWTRSVDYTYVYVNQVPVARMTIPSLMSTGVEEIFDASASSDDIVIVSYLWEFGDGTTSTEVKPIKRYDAEGTYTVTLSVTDNEGVTATATQTVVVEKQDSFGGLTVKVVDETGKALPYVPVYFDLGSKNQKILYTDATGAVTTQMVNGTHTIGMYAAGYLPVKKDVVVLAGASRTITLTTVEEDIVTGKFEVTRMTFEEIVAAGIDVYDPANQNVYSATVRVTYGSTPPLNISYVRNDHVILDYKITDSSGFPVSTYTNSNGETRKITGVTFIPTKPGGIGGGGGGTGEGSDVVAIIDIPAQASYLKEFFDVRPHIVNNASPDFVLKMNEVVLNVPEGMTLMNSVKGDYSLSNSVMINEIRGQETVTLAWVLRGDKAGEYDLSADFTGILAEFEEFVTARFETEEPIKVYGLEGVKFRILAADEVHNDTLYFNIELENQRDIDIYMPSIGLTDKIRNVTESVLNGNKDGDFSPDSYILNAYVESKNGGRKYLPITYDTNGKATTGIKVLTPGQKLVYEYVSYNAINYQGVAYFKEAAITEFEGILENIEVGSFHKQLYSFVDYSEKLDNMLSGSDPDLTAALNYILNHDNYYYHADVEGDIGKSILESLYESCSLVLSADLSVLTQDDQRMLIKKTITKILAESSVVAAVEDQMNIKYLETVSSMISDMEANLLLEYGDNEEDKEEIMGFATDLAKSARELTAVYREKGRDALIEEMSKKALSYSFGVGVEIASFLDTSDAYFSVSDIFGFTKDVVSGIFKGLSEAEMQIAYYGILKLQCSADVTNKVLDALIAATKKSASQQVLEFVRDQYLLSFAGISAISTLQLDERELIYVVANEMKAMLETEMTEYKENMIRFAETFEEVGKVAFEMAVGIVYKEVLGSTPIGLIIAAFELVDAVTGWGDYVKQIDEMQIYNELSKAFYATFNTSIQDGNRDDDFYTMLYLRALCEMRLYGESAFSEYIMGYVYGKYGIPTDEEGAVAKINRVMNTNYETLDAWWDKVQYEIVHSRDLLFNIEGTLVPVIPLAPIVTLDYETFQTVQEFGPGYEYCFGDGAWIPCTENGPIAFTVDEVPGTLRVRKAETAATMAGQIATVKIYARKNLSKLISVRYDGKTYFINNLSDKYAYQVLFTDTPEEADWSQAVIVLSSEGVAAVSGFGLYEYMLIRSCHNDELQETTSNPLTVKVAVKHQLNIAVDGDGTVSQTDSSGYYFIGDTVELKATVKEGSKFIGWKVNGTIVSTDAFYLIEMAEGLEIVAVFAPEHVYGELISAVAPGCESVGFKEHYYCADCGKFFDENQNMVDYSDLIIPANGHTYGDLMIGMPASCEASGMKAHYNCAECGKHFDENKNEVSDESLIIPALGHAYGDLVGVVPATCENTGVAAHYQCDVCEKYFDESKTEVLYKDLIIPAKGHTYSDLIAEIPADCENDGVKAHYSCTECDQNFDENKNEVSDESLIIPADGHAYGDWIITKSATCTESGFKAHYQCAVCDTYFNSSKVAVSYADLFIPAKGHDHAFIAEVPATCTERGIAAHYKCSVCNQYFDENKLEVVYDALFIPAKGHSVQDGTCLECGEQIAASYQQGTTVTYFKTLEEALAAVTKGTVAMTGDAELSSALVKSGVILDLNGYELTADYLIVTKGATVLDGGDGCIGGGLLKIQKDNLIFAAENGNGIVPVWNGVDGYLFTKVTFQQMTRSESISSAQYVFLPAFTNLAVAELLADGSADNSIKLQVRLTWDGGRCQQFYTYDEALVDQVFTSGDRFAFSLTVTGIEDITDIEASAVIATDTGAQAVADGIGLKVY